VSTVRLDPGAVSWREVQGEVIAVDSHNARYLGTNESAALLWPMLARGTTVDELAGALTERWTLPAQRAHADAEALVRWLGDAGLLLTGDA
jgi:hypothetical protein